MSRFLIVGYSGSGKSTLAREISFLTSIPYFDSDSLYWDSEWNLISDDEVVAKLPLSDDSWILDGNFVSHRDQVWSRATTIIWVNPPLMKGMFRLIKRNLGLWISRRPSWSGSRMPLNIAISGIVHGWKRRRKDQSNFTQFISEYPDKLIFKIQTRSDYETLLASIHQLDDK